MPPLYHHRNHILVVGCDQASYHDLAGILRKEGYGVLYARNVNEAMDLLHHNEIEIVLTEKDMPDRDGIALLREIKRVKPGVQVMIMTDNGCVHSYLEAMVLGAFEYFNKPEVWNECGFGKEKFRHSLDRRYALGDEFLYVLSDQEGPA